MGLDIYLYKYENFEDTQKREKLYSEKTEALWTKEYEVTPEKEKEEIRKKSKKIARELSLNEEWGEDAIMKTKIEIDSKTDPEHYFKIGYFRSSYNDNGINRRLENLGVEGLYEIFEPNDNYVFQPDWSKSLKKVDRAIKQLESRPNLRCFDIADNPLGQPINVSSEKAAIELVIEHINKNRKDGFGSYSNLDGQFFLDEPLKVLALVKGRQNTFMGKQQPCVYVVFEGENKWITDALKIVKETIEYVLAQPDKQKYYLHWSS